MISPISTRTSEETQAAFAASSINAKQAVAAQRSMEANQIPSRITEVQKAGITRAATILDATIQKSDDVSSVETSEAVSSTRNAASASVDSNLATAQAPTSDSLVGETTYNSLGTIRPVHSGTGHIFSASA
jgi:hypothetical protein